MPLTAVVTDVRRIDGESDYRVTLSVECDPDHVPYEPVVIGDCLYHALTGRNARVADLVSITLIVTGALT